MVRNNLRAGLRGSCKTSVNKGGASSGFGSNPYAQQGNVLTQSQQTKYNAIAKNRNGNTIAVRELETHIDNNEPIYKQKVLIIKNLDKKRAKGNYNAEGGILAFKNLTDNAEKSYTKEFGPSGMSVADRNQLAVEMQNDYSRGDYDGTY